MSNEIDLYNDLEEAEEIGDTGEVKKITEQIKQQYPDLTL